MVNPSEDQLSWEQIVTESVDSIRANVNAILARFDTLRPRPVPPS